MNLAIGLVRRQNGRFRNSAFVGYQHYLDIRVSEDGEIVVVAPGVDVHTVDGINGVCKINRMRAAGARNNAYRYIIELAARQRIKSPNGLRNGIRARWHLHGVTAAVIGIGITPAADVY